MTMYYSQGAFDEIFNRIADFVLPLEKSIHSAILAAIAGAGVLLAVVIFLIFFHKNKKLRKVDRLKSAVLLGMNPVKGLDFNTNLILDIIRQKIELDCYTFYILDNSKHAFILKSVMNKQYSNGNIVPSYSGLLPYKKEGYVPPIAVDSGSYDGKFGVVKDGDIPLFVIPIEGGKGFIRLGPVKKIGRSLLKDFKLLSHILGSQLDNLIETDRLLNRNEVLDTLNVAMKKAANVVSDTGYIASTVVKFSMKATGAVGGFLIRKDNSILRIVAEEGICGISDEGIQKISRKESFLELIDALFNYEIPVCLQMGDHEYDNLKGYFAEGGQIGFFIGSEIKSGWESYIILFLFDKDHLFNQQLIESISGISSRIGVIFGNHAYIKKSSGSYIEVLNQYSRMIDNFRPFTVGYSELMAHYCAVIARKMGFSKDEIVKIALAGRFSNIGILGVSWDILEKRGRYTELEFEKMKLHSEVGAVIIESTISDTKIAEYIRYHHERIDGYGYPAGLAGDEIPIGARIIAVVQTFITKISGRVDREPMSFNNAIDELVRSSGTQLDSSVVNTLVDWFREKQSSPAVKAKSLGCCWEMRCAPEEICSQCPAFGNTERNCWENSGIKCELHGNRCDKCFIYTEYLGRKAVNAN